MRHIITEKRIKLFENALLCDEKGKRTIAKYLCDIRKLKDYLQGQELTKERFLAYRSYLEQSGKYKVSSINSFLTVANHFCEVMGWEEIRIRMLKVQREPFLPESRELTKREYERLVRAAWSCGNEKLALLLQTLADTGIRISELQFICVESLARGEAEICNKGKRRRIFFSESLTRVLKEYVKKEDIRSGCIFRTRSGKALDRSNIWRAMKKLCHQAGVPEEKVYPHSLRHLFARCFYQLKKDIAKLADVMGHSNIETTRIYIRTTGREHKRYLNKMHMILPDIENNRSRERQKSKENRKIRKQNAQKKRELVRMSKL